MSSVNIRRAVENIKSNTTVYTPIVEVIVNAIQAIEMNPGVEGKIKIRVKRVLQTELDGNIPDVLGFEIEDNGIGFTDENRNSFDTLYSDAKISLGGKGFGRFTCLKYFDNLIIESVYHDSEKIRLRKFKMGHLNDIIEDEKILDTSETASRTVVRLFPLKKEKTLEKKLNTIGRILVEKMLPFFITKDYACPKIILSEIDDTNPICLNDFFSNELSAVIKEIPVESGDFKLKATDSEEAFSTRVFKIYFPKAQKSRISLVAHKREVSGTAISKYIPEFIDEFYEKNANGEENRDRNYIIKAYVFGNYLDKNVSLERGGFEFQAETDLVYGISQSRIEQEAAKIAMEAVGPDITVRVEKKLERIKNYVDEEAPWHKGLLDKVDVGAIPYNPTDGEIEAQFQKQKHTQEVQIKKDVTNLLADSNIGNLKKNVLEIVGKISGTSKNDLIHYIALRKNILDIFGKSLQTDESGKYESEGVVHDIIFPRKRDSDRTTFEDHNLWIVDERLNFTTYVSSDLPLNGGNTERPDLLVYNKRILFRGDNEASNPITIFEFKKPPRDDFVNPSSTEDPIQQIVRYVNNIRDGQFKTPKGRKILVAENTPFYGYVVCDLTTKVETWLEREKNFKVMPDRLGWFYWFENINLYVEVLSWDKVIRDAKMRNQIFFHKLGI